MSSNDHLITTMRMNDGRILQRIPSHLAHQYLNLDPTEVSWQALAFAMRQAGWSGPRSIYIKNMKGQQILRGFERKLEAV